MGIKLSIPASCLQELLCNHSFWWLYISMSYQELWGTKSPLLPTQIFKSYPHVIFAPHPVQKKVLYRYNWGFFVSLTPDNFLATNKKHNLNITQWHSRTVNHKCLTLCPFAKFGRWTPGNSYLIAFCLFSFSYVLFISLDLGSSELNSKCET